MDLKEGRMTLRELSLWFGYKNPDGLAKALQKTKDEKFRLLKTYADYHFVGKSVYIDKVKIPVYSKLYEKIEDLFSKEWGSIPGSSHLNNI